MDTTEIGGSGLGYVKQRLIRVTPGRPIKGRVRVPGDKSISHRAAILGAIARGRTTVRGYLASDDCLRTLDCISMLGAEVCRTDTPQHALGTCLVQIEGRGERGLCEPADILDVGNSGTAIRLLAGVLAGQPFFSVITGDEQVRRRPMRRITEPLTSMGARIWGRQHAGLAPLAVMGGYLRAVSFRSPVASAQVKSAVLLAGLYADGETVVQEPSQSRDHTERMLLGFGAQVRADGTTASVQGPAALTGREVTVPGDISSAAFLIVAALIVPGSELTIEGVGVNPTRTGLIDVLREMGGEIEVHGEHLDAGEPVADITVRTSELRGVHVGSDMIPRLVDEIPILAVAAAVARGETVISDAQELRVKETDRLATTAEMIRAFGGRVEERPDGLVVAGVPTLTGTECTSHGDHRIAMSAVVAGLAADGETVVHDTECISTSFPCFAEVMASAGAAVEEQ